MIVTIAALLGELCVPPLAAAQPDVAESATYAAVGDDAGPGDPRVAAIAYRKALALDPGNAHARDALAALCRADRDRAHGGGDGADLADAVARYRRGELDDAARELAALVAANRDAAAAHFFLGMIALARHDGRTAEAEYAAAARDPAYVELAADMRRLARRDGPLAVSVLASTEIDTNPQLIPDTPPQGEAGAPPATDGDEVIGASVVARPASWLALRELASFRRYLSQTDRDFFAETAEAEGELVAGPWHATAGYGFDYDALAGTSYLLANRVALAVRHDDGALAVAGSYALRRRDFLETGESGFTGWVHAGELAATLHASRQLDLEAAVVGWRELTEDPAFTDSAGGGRVAARARVASGMRASAGVTAWYATYDGAEPDGSLRRDTHVEGELQLEIDLGDLWTAIVGATAAWNGSTIADFDYTRVIAHAGVAFALGAP